MFTRGEIPKNMNGVIPLHLTQKDLDVDTHILAEVGHTAKAATVVTDRNTGVSRGFAYIEMFDDSSREARAGEGGGQGLGFRV